MKKETLQWIKSNPMTQAGEKGAHLDMLYEALVSLRCTDRASWETAWIWQPRSAGNTSRANKETPSPKSWGAWGNIKEMGWSWLVSQNSNLRFIGYLFVLQLLSGGREIVASFPSVRKAQFPQTDPSWSTRMIQSSKREDTVPIAMKNLIQDTAEHLTSIILHLFVNCLLMPFTNFKRSEFIYFFIEA